MNSEFREERRQVCPCNVSPQHCWITFPEISFLYVSLSCMNLHTQDLCGIRRVDGKQPPFCRSHTMSLVCWLTSSSCHVCKYPNFPGSFFPFSKWQARYACLLAPWGGPWLLQDTLITKVRGNNNGYNFQYILPTCLWVPAGSPSLPVNVPLPFPTTHAVDFQLQHQTQRQLPYGACSASSTTV